MVVVKWQVSVWRDTRCAAKVAEYDLVALTADHAEILAFNRLYETPAKVGGKFEGLYFETRRV